MVGSLRPVCVSVSHSQFIEIYFTVLVIYDMSFSHVHLQV